MKTERDQVILIGLLFGLPLAVVVLLPLIAFIRRWISG